MGKNKKSPETDLQLVEPDESQLAGKFAELVSKEVKSEENVVVLPNSKKPVVKLNGNALCTTRAFNVVRNEKLDYLYLVQLELAHEGEINPMKLIRDQAEVVSIQFKKHTEEYKGNFINFAIKWQEDEEPVLVLFFTCTRIK